MIRLTHALIITIAALTGLGFLWLERIYSNTPLLGELTVPVADSTLAILALLVSGLTSPAVVIMVSVTGALFAAYKHQIILWWLFVGLLSVGLAASTILKIAISLPRPEYGLVQLSSYGFPSTHATLATIIFITASWFAYHWQVLSHRLIIAGIGISWLTVCASRILLGVHSLSDVLAGIMLGTAIGAVALFLAPHIFKHYDIPLQKS